MINFSNIFSVSTYERKTLFRSWFFRIFSILALFFLFSINIGFYGNHGDAQWVARAIASNLPYMNVLFINIAQSIIAVFLASDFLRRDKKLDTTEVIYTRPISNAEYVLGKTLGILILFVGLVILSLIMVLVFNLIKKDVPIVWIAYLYYPLLITIPSLVFILGLSFTLMILIKNQAVTFIVLLGYIGLTLFYFQDKVNGLMDYMAFNLPMVYSDIVHFTDFKLILLHRLAYFGVGVGFIFLTIRYLNRLPQVGRRNFINLLLSIVFVTAGVAGGYSYFTQFNKQEKNREGYIALNNKYAKQPTVDVLSNKIYVEHKGRRLKISSDMSVLNSNESSIDTIVFSLNPGFTLDSITSFKGKVDFVREKQIIKIVPKGGLASHGRAKYGFHYSGNPEESIAYLDLPKEVRNEIKRMMVAPVNKKAAIVHDNYVLLTPEILWYPIAGVGFNSQTFQNRKLDFVRFRLSVKTKEGLTAISAGKAKQEKGLTKFIPENDLNSLSLVIGNFERKTLEIDKVEYNLYVTPGHDFFSQYFTNITDTIGSIIKSAKDNYENEELDLYYPFLRINLIETPVQFHSYERAQVQTTQFIQPEMIFFPEKGVGLNSLDFARFKHFEEKSNKKQDNSRTEKEIEISMLKRFLQTTFFRDDLYSRPEFERQWGDQNLMSFEGTNYKQNPYCVFPLYYSYVTGIHSTDFPLFNSMMEIYLKKGFEVSFRQTFKGGMTERERANLALKDNSLEEIFTNWEPELISSIVSQTGSFVIQALKNRVGIGEFDSFLYYYLEDHSFQTITFEQFAADFYKEFKVDIIPYFQTISTQGKIPAFLMSTVEFFQSNDEVGEVYLVKFKITNTGDARGIVDITFRMPGQGGGSGEQRIFEAEAGESKDIQITLYEQPRMMSVNTLISENIPSTFSVFLRAPEKIGATNFEEYAVTSDVSVKTDVKGEYIVDNEDEGFSYVSVSTESKIKQYIDSRKKQKETVHYETLHQWWSPSVWTPVAHSAYYGETVRSALVSRSGDGKNIAKWTTVLDEAGDYDIYVFIPISAMSERPDRRNNNEDEPGKNQGGQSRGFKFVDKGFGYYYVVSSVEGTDEIKFVLKDIDEGWNKLGTFHFPADSSTVSLSNRIEGRRVIADAVKWVKK